jgi:hypothetical protein
MVLVLANALDLPLRERNRMLGEAGFAAVYASEGLESLALQPVRQAVSLLLERQEPYPALLMDRSGNLLRANGGARLLLETFLGPDVPPELATNLYRATLHPQGFGRFVVNFPEVAAYILDRLERECALSPSDPGRQRLRSEILCYPGLAQLPRRMVVPLPVAGIHFRRGALELRLFGMLSTLGTPLDVSAEELVLESFFPLDQATAAWFAPTVGA